MSNAKEGEGPAVEPLRKRKGFATLGERSQVSGSQSKRKRSGEVFPAAEGFQDPAEMSATFPEQGHRNLDGHHAPVEAQAHKPIFLLDLFCGTAGVAAAFKALGGDALGIDHMVDKRRVKGPVAKVDLAQKDGQRTVLSWIEDGKVDAVMLAPPCGTSSRAREIPLPKRFRLRKGMQPVPLRSDRWPDGLPELRGVAKLKVEAANKLYRFSKKVIELCLEKGIPFICENPRRSLMWLTEPFSVLPETCRFQYIHACMYGSRRRKSMNFLAENLQTQCDGQHTHLPWGMVDPHDGSGLKFSTSLETEYPQQLCKQLAMAFLDNLQQKGKAPQPPEQCDDQLQKMGAGTQPRGTRAPLLLGEFKCKVEVTSSDVPIPATINHEVHFPFQGVPVDAKLISSRDAFETGSDGEKRPCKKSVFGVFRSPWDFFARTLQVEHPLDSPQLVDPCNLRAIMFIRDHSAAEVAMFRVKQLKRFSQRAVELAAEEAELKASLNEDVRTVLADKRLLLFKEMASEAQVGDDGLFDELVKGFSLTGAMPESGTFPAKLRPAQISVQQLKESAVWARKMIHTSCRRVASDKEIAHAVYQETLQQLSDGWVKGPFTEAQLDAKYNNCWIPSKRFGVRQGQKIRAVDDFSEFLVNASVSSTEKLQLFGIDEVINTARTFLGCNCLEAHDNGAWLKDGRRDPSRPTSWYSLKGRALDLKAAYKQLARDPQDAWASILAVWNDERQQVEFFESIALPFGSVCAVMAFNRMARALRLILSSIFMLVNTNFFDDFCQLELDSLCNSSWQTAELVMRPLGWKISMSEDKRLPFSQEFSMLGAVVDLSRTAEGVVSVRNKDSRVEDIGKLVDDLCNRDVAPMSLLETLRGRLLYAAGHTFGRCTQLAIQLVSKLSRCGPMVVMDATFKSVLKAAFMCLSTAKPRRVEAWSGRWPVIVFTDGACEDDGKVVTHGAVLHDPESDTSLMFGDHVPESWVDRWRAQGKKQLICQAEIFPILVAKTTWEPLLSGRAVLWFVDNNSALAAVIRSFSPVVENFELLIINANLDVKLQSLNWYSRVPSKANLSDSPSRMDFDELTANGFRRCQPVYETLTIK